MTKKPNTRDLKITFIHQFKRATRTEWDDKFRITWYFNPDTLDYVYEHKNENFCTNGFVVSDRLIEQLPDEFQKKYFLPAERCLVFLLFVFFLTTQLMSGLNRSNYSEGCFAALFPLSKL